MNSQTIISTYCLIINVHMSKFSVKWCTDLSQTETTLRKILLIQCNICTVDYCLIFFICFQPLLQQSYSTCEIMFTDGYCF